ncbi:MAG: type II toxin-antitoxin system Phd/YefM family antitoxin [Clostridiales Family XIII bacterium]|jgi:PHD/YefM family antitoxin component YafN of YafNO toxin-antitoxin module|nr:type II toxin-antitoxin system Phd/YefM family antitoxin [Clostridiales Family XIII bacterium]
MVTRYTPTAARKNLYGIIKDVTNQKQAVEIAPATVGGEGVAVIPLSDWSSIKETLFLEQTGVLDVVRTRENDDSGFTNANDIDWDEL